MKKWFIQSKILMILIFISFIVISCKQTANKELIIGKWQFLKYTSEFEESEISEDEAQMIRDSNNANKDLILTFAENNLFQSQQKRGVAINNSKGEYSIVGKDIIVIVGDTAKILQLDKMYLKLYIKGRPIITFKRL